MRPIRRKFEQNGGRKALLAAEILPVFLLLVVMAVGQTSVTKAVGTVKSVSANSVVLTTDSGTETTVTFSDSARIVRAIPGQGDLKNAAPIPFSDIQVGDRVAARGQAAESGSFVATVAIVMKQGDIADVHQRERDEWRRGVGGIVKSVDTSAGTITIANSFAAGGKPILIHVSTGADIKRYSPDSLKFDDARPSTLDQVRPGDQVRARGTKNADGTEFTAQAIVSGAFRDVAGTVVSTDVTNNSVTISDLATKKPITIKVGPDSQLRKLPQGVAMAIAMRLKGGAAGAGASGAGGGAAGGTWQGRRPEADSGGSGNQNRGWQGTGGGIGAGRGQGMGAGQGNWRGNGPPDFQQMLARMPAVSISDLNKGDAVMLVATQGTANSQPTAITLLAGVEPILSAAPASSNAASTILSPWNLGQSAAAGGDAAGQ